MIFPSIEELTQSRINRYELVIVVAKAARKIVDVQNQKKEENEKLNGKDGNEKNIPKFEIPEEKAVKTAINKIYEKEFVIKF